MIMKKNFFSKTGRGILTGLLSLSFFTNFQYATASEVHWPMANTSLFYKKSYEDISNTKHDWWFTRNKDHLKVEGGNPTEINLKKYNAYYLNETTKENVIYLTFDCGYENGFTKSILKTLKSHNAKAIFFVTKAFIEKNPELNKQIKKEGHMVGNHTCSHPSLPSKSISQIKDELNTCANIFKETTGYTMDPYMRPPMGCYSERTLQLFKDLGYSTIFWSMAYLDYDVENQPGKDYVINHFKENHHKGAIPLIHNISKSNTEALDEVLTFLEKKGYRFGTLDELTFKKGILKISCPDKEYDGTPITITNVKNTNKDQKITYSFKNEKGSRVKNAIKPGTYSVTAKVASNQAYNSATSNTVTFTITKPTNLTFWEAFDYLQVLYDDDIV